MSAQSTAINSERLKVLAASLLLCVFTMELIPLSGLLAIFDITWDLSSFTESRSKVAATLLSFAACLVTIKYGIRPFIKGRIIPLDAGRFGAEVALKLTITCSVGLILHYALWGGLKAFLGWLFAVSLAAIWITSDRRKRSSIRLGILLAVAILAIYGSVQAFKDANCCSYDGPDGTYTLLDWGLDIALLAMRTIELAFIGFFIGLLCAGQETVQSLTPLRTNFSTSYRALFFGKTVTSVQLGVGLLVAAILTTLFLALHSIVFQGYSIRPFRLVDIIPKVTKVFDPNAIHHLPTALWSSVPFLLLGAALFWVLSRCRFNGVLPVITLGGLMGLMWSQNVLGLYRWMFFEFHLSGILAGMIIAAGSGAVINAVSPRFGIKPTPPQPPSSNATPRPIDQVA